LGSCACSAGSFDDSLEPLEEVVDLGSLMAVGVLATEDVEVAELDDGADGA
jgi:hypothetical protein